MLISEAAGRGSRPGARNKGDLTQAPDLPSIGVEPDPAMLGEPVAVYDRWARQSKGVSQTTVGETSEACIEILNSKNLHRERPVASSRHRLIQKVSCRRGRLKLARLEHCIRHLHL